MSATAYRITTAVLLLLMLVGVGVSIYPGGCDALIPTETGAVPMRCHWSFLATSVLFGVGALGSLGQFTLTTKEGRRVAAVAFLLLAATAGFLPSPLGIGICSSDGGAQSLADGGEMMTLCMVDGGSMDCQITAPLIWGVCALVALIAIIQWAKADPDGAVKPRFQDGA